MGLVSGLTTVNGSATTNGSTTNGLATANGASTNGSTTANGAKPAMPANKDLDYDVLIIGAGLSGIYSLYRMRQMGLRAKVIEAGSGEGGTWFW
jgi:heterodisulfide reductase subunit A-like polyferredoxin